MRHSGGPKQRQGPVTVLQLGNATSIGHNAPSHRSEPSARATAVLNSMSAELARFKERNWVGLALRAGLILGERSMIMVPADSRPFTAAAARLRHVAGLVAALSFRPLARTPDLMWPRPPGRIMPCPLPTLPSSAVVPSSWPVNGPNRSLSWRRLRLARYVRVGSAVSFACRGAAAVKPTHGALSGLGHRRHREPALRQCARLPAPVGGRHRAVPTLGRPRHLAGRVPLTTPADPYLGRSQRTPRPRERGPPHDLHPILTV